MVEIMKMMFLVAFLLLHAESIEGYEFRLLPSNSQGREGFVEIFYNGSWGLIGHPEVELSNYTATLLCRKLNLSLFGYGAIYMLRENFTSRYYWLSHLECNGNERSIDECVKTDELRRNYKLPGLVLQLQNYGNKLYCVDYRLIGGISPNTGMLIAAFSSTQHSMCYQGFDSNAGDVVCKHLRYNGLVAFTDGDPDSIPLFNNKLTCTGNESSLNECTMSNAVIENCTRAVYITCKAVRLTTWNEYNNEGTVEIFYKGSWGVVGGYGYGFSDVTAKFLCETFGFRKVGFSSGCHSSEPYLGVKGWFGHLSCNGTEVDIMQCAKPSSFGFRPYDTLAIGTWLYCFDINITSMRLVNGPNPNEGDVQLQIGGRWGSIIMQGQKNTSQVKTVGSVVCQILGYVGVSKIVDAFVINYNNKYTWMSNLFCNGNEKDLMDCNYTLGACSYDSLAVKCEDTDQCQSNPCLNNGTCVDGDRSYTCNCTERWSGINCEIDLEYNKCQEQPCDNNSTCINSPAGYKCLCTEGFNGDNCAIDVDECLSDPCENNGNCTDSSNKYTCSCVHGYGGERCQTDIDECLSQPCQNNGACVNEINGFVCYCDQGYEGYRCQNEIDDQTTLIVVLISSICVLSIVVLATVCCCLRYRREHTKTKSDASNVLNSKEVEEEGHCNDVDYEEIKENTLDDNADYINDVNDEVQPKDDADGYVEFANNDQNVGYYKLKHTKTEDYSKLSVF